VIHSLLALDIGWGTTLAIKTVIILAIVPLTALVLGYVFLLKMMSHMQSRLGPMDPGGFHGWFQLVGDGIKFIQKEDITPAQADKRVFALAPAVVVISTFLVFLVIPAGPDIVVKDLNVGVFYALAVSSLSVIGVLMAGWASANKFSLLGALRAAAQLIAYELPLLLAVVGVVIQAGTMNLQGIVAFQSTGSIFGFDGIGFPLILTQFIGFGLFLVASQAELTQTPFDMPVAESELVAGYMVEYTGFRFLSSSSASSAPRSPSPPLPPPSTSAAGPSPRRGASRWASCASSAPSCCSPRSWGSPSSCSGCASRIRACAKTSCRHSRGSS
jgi:NADH-quinone oxidoreductase subunit H